jgi:hypothetical protein
MLSRAISTTVLTVLSPDDDKRLKPLRTSGLVYLTAMNSGVNEKDILPRLHGDESF